MPTYNAQDRNQVERETLELRATNKTVLAEIKKAEDALNKKKDTEHKLTLDLAHHKDAAHLNMVKLLHMNQLETKRAHLNVKVDPLCNSTDEISARYNEQISTLDGAKTVLENDEGTATMSPFKHAERMAT